MPDIEIINIPINDNKQLYIDTMYSVFPFSVKKLTKLLSTLQIVIRFPNKNCKEPNKPPLYISFPIIPIRYIKEDPSV